MIYSAISRRFYSHKGEFWRSINYRNTLYDACVNFEFWQLFKQLLLVWYIIAMQCTLFKKSFHHLSSSILMYNCSRLKNTSFPCNSKELERIMGHSFISSPDQYSCMESKQIGILRYSEVRNEIQVVSKTFWPQYWV